MAHPLAIDSSQIHLWRIPLDRPELGESRQVLSPDELARAARFYFDRDRRRYSLSRSFLRCTLAGYLDCSPGELRFGYGEFGKPFLEGEGGEERLTFNLAHSHELAVLAVARGREVGIDVEYRRPGFATENVQEHFFAPEEVREIRSLPPELREKAFFTCWTRKEAYIKARGQGLSIPLHEFVVAATPGKKPALLSTSHDPPAVLRWSICDLDTQAGYESALAFEGLESAVQLIYCG